MKSPTKKQLDVERFIQRQQERHGCAPTLREIATHFGYKSTNAVRSHLRLLKEKGRLKLLGRKARGIQVVTASKPSSSSRRGQKKAVEAPGGWRSGVPLLGTIPAGPMEEALVTSDEILPLEAGLFRGDQVFALRVKGDSMKNVGILPGDYAILNSQDLVSDGQIAAVYEDEEATLKRVFRRPEGLLLRPENDHLKERLITPSEAKTVRILGRLVGLLRVEGGVR